MTTQYTYFLHNGEMLLRFTVVQANAETVYRNIETVYWKYRIVGWLNLRPRDGVSVLTVFGFV